MNSDQIRTEEAKRDRNWEPAERWRVLQETIAWAATQSTVNCNSIEARLAEQNRELTWFTEYCISNSNRHRT